MMGRSIRFQKQNFQVSAKMKHPDLPVSRRTIIRFFPLHILQGDETVFTLENLGNEYRSSSIFFFLPSFLFPSFLSFFLFRSILSLLRIIRVFRVSDNTVIWKLESLLVLLSLLVIGFIACSSYLHCGIYNKALKSTYFFPGDYESRVSS